MAKRRIVIKRENSQDARDQEIEKLQEQITKLQHTLRSQHVYNLSVKLRCTSGNASFHGSVEILDLDGSTLTKVPIDGFFRSARRREATRSFEIPLLTCPALKKEVQLGDPTSPDWQKHAETELDRRHPEHILAMRNRRRI